MTPVAAVLLCYRCRFRYRRVLWVWVWCCAVLCCVVVWLVCVLFLLLLVWSFVVVWLCCWDLGHCDLWIAIRSMLDQQVDPRAAAHNAHQQSKHYRHGSNPQPRRFVVFFSLTNISPLAFL